VVVAVALLAIPLLMVPAAVVAAFHMVTIYQ
jgi:hypothetical protein